MVSMGGARIKVEVKSGGQTVKVGEADCCNNYLKKSISQGLAYRARSSVTRNAMTYVAFATIDPMQDTSHVSSTPDDPSAKSMASREDFPLSANRSIPPCLGHGAR